jgi:hypothetical protein
MVDILHCFPERARMFPERVRLFPERVRTFPKCDVPLLRPLGSIPRVKAPNVPQLNPLWGRKDFLGWGPHWEPRVGINVRPTGPPTLTAGKKTPKFICSLGIVLLPLLFRPSARWASPMEGSGCSWVGYHYKYCSVMSRSLEPPLIKKRRSCVNYYILFVTQMLWSASK